jgi:hypothetical protein
MCDQNILIHDFDRRVIVQRSWSGTEDEELGR